MITLATITDRFKVIGPGFIWAAAAIGSGELIIASKVGSEYGLAFVWALWLGVWLKYWIQKGILDLTILTGKPVVELWHGKRFGKLSSWYWLVFFILNATGVAGLVGLSATIMHALIPFLNVTVWAIILTGTIIALAYFQNYGALEKTMLAFCAVLAVGVIATAILAHPAPRDLFAWALPGNSAAMLVFLSLLGWGAGSGPDLMLPYSWWVTEKGYHTLSVNQGAERLADATEPDAVLAVKRWLVIAKWDTIFGYVAAGVVASVFMIAGAEVLRPRGIVVDGMAVLSNLATIFTSTFGSWAFYIFMIPAFAAIFSTALGVFDGGRIAIAHIARRLMGLPTLAPEVIRGNAWYRVALILFSIVPLVLFLAVKQPVLLVITAGAISAIAMPVLALQIFWSLYKDIPARFRPSIFALSNLVLAAAVYVFFTGQALYVLAGKWF